MQMEQKKNIIYNVLFLPPRYFSPTLCKIRQGGSYAK